MLDIIARIKNVEPDHRPLGGTEDVGEAETALVLVPGAKRRRSELALARALEEPDDEGGVEEADEGRDAQDRRLRSCGRVGETEQLLALAEKDLSGKGLARYRLTSSARFQSLPIGTVHADFPHTARPVSLIRRVMGRAVLAAAFTRTCRRSRGAGVSSSSTTRERRRGIRYSTSANPRSSFVSAFVASEES